MTSAPDTWYVLADGTHALPQDVSADKDGVMRHKNGVPVALRDNGVPLTSGVATKSNKQAAEAVPAADAKANVKKDKSADATAEKQAPAPDNREMKAADDKSADYKTR